MLYDVTPSFTDSALHVTTAILAGLVIGGVLTVSFVVYRAAVLWLSDKAQEAWDNYQERRALRAKKDN